MIIDVLAGWLASKKRTAPPQYIVLHHDAGRWAGTLSTLRKSGYSYNYYIRKNGRVVKCTPASRVAFHAGATFAGEDGSRVVNENSIGICFENLGDGTDPYTDEQIRACHELIAEICRNTPTITHLTTHRLITMYPSRNGRSRKIDPVGINPKTFALAAGLKLWVPWPGAK